MIDFFLLYDEFFYKENSIPSRCFIAEMYMNTHQKILRFSTFGVYSNIFKFVNGEISENDFFVYANMNFDF